MKRAVLGILICIVSVVMAAGAFAGDVRPEWGGLNPMIKSICEFRTKSNTHSGVNRTAVPVEIEQ
jgi:hypothetical protein